MKTPLPIPDALVVNARCQGGLVSAAQCDRHGVTPNRRRRLVDSGRWDRLTRGVYDTRETDPSMHRFDVSRLRCSYQGLLAYPASAAVGIGALVLLGVKGLPRTFTPEVAMPRARSGRSRDGIRVRQYDFHGETVVVAGRRVAAVGRALAQAIPGMSRNGAVAALDSAANLGLLDETGLSQVRTLLAGRRGNARCRGWLDLLDGRAESPNETLARLMCGDAGIGPDDLQRVFVDERGRFLGRADLAWHLGGDRWLIVEIDSQQFHSLERDVRSDAYRQNGLMAVGRHQVLRYFSEHLREDRVLGDHVVVHVLRSRE